MISMPNFFVVGAASSGTTSLYHYLKQHPQIFMSPVKEPHFFSFAGKEFNPTSISGYEEKKIETLEAYQTLFEAATDELAIGEVSPSYLYTPCACERIRQAVPDAKLIAILRNPVDRAYSNYLRCLRQGVEPIADFAEALRQEASRIQENWPPKWFYKWKGFYYQQLKQYFKVFDKDQIKVCLFEDLSKDPVNLMQDLFDFLGVDRALIPNSFEKYNYSFVPKSRFLSTFLSTRNSVKSTIKLLLPEKLHQVATANLKSWNQKQPQLLSPEIRNQLVQEYREDILKLQDLLQRDLSAWFKSQTVLES